VSRPPISLILAVGAEPSRLRPTLDSLCGQSMSAETVAVVTTDQRSRARVFAPEIDIVVDLAAADWTPGRAINAGAAVATAPIHSTIAAGYALPRPDWLERVLAHHRREEVAGASGARWDRDGGLLLDSRDVHAVDWTESWGFSTAACGWRATAWERRRFPEEIAGAADRIWGWEILRAGAVLVVDPFLQLDGPPLHPPRAWSIFRRTAEDWAGLVSADAPLTAPSFSEALGGWWNEVDARSATPAALQRLNYFRLARALGRWAGGRRAARGPRASRRAPGGWRSG
jgi:hypothetical protein